MKYLYETGVYTIKDVIQYVNENIITKEQFHFITSYNYDGYCEIHNIKKIRG
ncbi:MAG: XkdX family protein [Clostridia bacterium]|nr:XkdX family protein [Clostridia bacterium]